MISRQAALALATWGGVGFFPVAPGTAASLVALAIAWLLVVGLGMSPVLLAGLAVLLFWPAARAATTAEKHFRRADPRQIVVDEVIGQWLALSVVHRAEWTEWLAAFVLFRTFDIVKPFPIRRLERLPGGYGVVADDAAAGLYAMIVLMALQRLILR